MITAALFVAAAAVGAVARAEVVDRLNRRDGIAYGTLAVNVAGSFVLGLLSDVAPPAITILGVGLVGTFTTFSGFALDVTVSLRRRRAADTVVYVLATCAGGVAAAAAGVALAT